MKSNKKMMTSRNESKTHHRNISKMWIFSKVLSSFDSINSRFLLIFVHCYYYCCQSCWFHHHHHQISCILPSLSTILQCFGISIDSSRIIVGEFTFGNNHSPPHFMSSFTFHFFKFHHKFQFFHLHFHFNFHFLLVQFFPQFPPCQIIQSSVLVLLLFKVLIFLKKRMNEWMNEWMNKLN